MPEACDSGNNSKRLKKYRDLWGDCSLYDAVIRQTEETLRLSPGTRLYLYGFVPAIMEFAQWVLEEAVRSGRKRLYFLSRDGYQIYLAASSLAEWKGIPVECRYLHISRYAVRVPAYHLDRENCLDMICAGGMDVTLERILKRGALTDEEADGVAKRIGRKDTCRNILSRREIGELKEILRNEPIFMKTVMAHSVEAYENAMGYLQQEGLLSEIPYGIVDSGWVGTFQQSLQLLVRSGGKDIRVTGYYFGLYEIPEGAKAGDYHGWYFTPRRGLARKACFSNSLFEAVCGADEGMTVGYFREGDRFLPVLDPEGNPNSEEQRRHLEALKCFLGKYKAAVKEKAFIIDGLLPGKTGIRLISRSDIRDGRKRIRKMFMLFMARPTMAETENFGDYLFSDDVLTGNCRTVAARLTGKEIRNLYILRRLCILGGLGKGRIQESAWIEGSIVRCKTDRFCVNRSLLHIRWYKYLVYGRKQLRAWMHEILSCINDVYDHRTHSWL